MSGSIKRIEQVFQSAADLAPDERAAFLDRECPSEPEVRERVEAMLAHFDQDETLLRPAGPWRENRAELTTEGPGTTIGRYRLLERLGEGGFGTVYLAEQRDFVVRKVALKVIKLGMDTKEVVARFDAERQALAMMDHPNIAGVLDGGATATGRPYFVMELVRGLSLTEYCKRNGLSVEARLELFLQVCDAVQHAHQKGIIHRDLKPNNVLVATQNGVAIPKVIDFGVAKAIHTRLTEKTLFTAQDRFIGTPAYMSPEQAEMSGEDIDTRTDIYSLGVLLYELLTGTTPFETRSLVQGGLVEIQRVLKEEQPPRPSVRINTSSEASAGKPNTRELSRRVRGDLDWIVMKALEKERTRRYPTANALADDIRRHLDREPVQAGQPSAAYRMRKFLLRHRAAAITVGLVGAALIAGIIGTSAAMVEASRQRDAAQQQADHARSITDFLISTLALTNPDIALTPELSVRTLLDRAGEQVAVGRLSPQAEARVRSTIGRAYESLGEFELAETHLRRSVELTDRLGVYDPPEFYLTLWRLTHCLFQLERDDAFEFAVRARSVAHEHIRSRHPELAETLERFLNAVQEAARGVEGDTIDRARALFSEASRSVDEVLPPGDPLWPMVADTFMDAGYTLWYTPHEPANEPFFAKTLEIQRRELPPKHPDIAETVSQLVGVLNRSGQGAEAESRIRESIDTLREVYPEGSFQLAFTESMLGNNLVVQGRYAEAEPVLLASHAVILEHVEEETNFYAVDSYARLVALYEGWGREDKARPYREALTRIGLESSVSMSWEMMRLSFGPQHRELSLRLARMDELCGTFFYPSRAGDLDGTEITVLVDEVLAERRRALRDDDPLSGVTARLLLGWSNAVVAGPVQERMAEEAQRVLRQWPDRAQLEIAEALARQAGAVAAQDVRRAGELAEEAAKWIPRTFRGDWITANKKVRIARAFVGVGLFEEAESLLGPAHSVLEVQQGSTGPDTLEARRVLHELYTAWGRPEEAARYAGIPSPTG